MKFFSVLLPFVIGFILLAYGALPIYATTYSQGGVLVNPSASYAACGDPSVCTNLGACWNDERAGVTGCNGNACSVNGTPFGDPWTKYNYSYCALYNLDVFTDSADCRPVYNSLADLVYSDADKCVGGETVLRPGFCDGSWGGSGYKKCCSSGTGIQCQNYSIQDPYYPPEGVCPGGNYVPCGYGSYPACNDPNVCGGPTCTEGTPYNQCGQTGGCTNNYASNHTVQVTPNSCSDGTTTYSCSDLGVFAGQCGNPGPTPTPTPSPTPAPANDASTCTAISVNGGNPVIAGQSYSATVSMRNDGTSTWISDLPNPYKLGSQDPQDNSVWSLNRVNLPSSPKAPGTTATFNFNVWAPSTAGTYSFNWRMVREGVQWFGSKCFYNVTVSTPTPTPTRTPTPTPTITPTPTPTRTPTPTPTRTPTPTPTSTPAPGAPSVTVTPACFPSTGYTGSGVTISWTAAGVTWVNISSDPAFGSYYHKAVIGVLSTTGPDGFNLNPSSPPQPLILYPLPTTYYARTYNGTNSPGASFSRSACVTPTPTPTPTSIPPTPTPGGLPTPTPTTGPGTPTPTPTPSGGCPWIQTTGGDVHSNTGIDTGC